MAWGLIGTDSFGEFRQMGSYIGWNGADWESAALAYLSTEASEAERLEMSAVPYDFSMPALVRKFSGNYGPVSAKLCPVEFKLKKPPKH